jgi:hypothetical protein
MTDLSEKIEAAARASVLAVMSRVRSARIDFVMKQGVSVEYPPHLSKEGEGAEIATAALEAVGYQRQREALEKIAAGHHFLDGRQLAAIARAAMEEKDG